MVRRTLMVAIVAFAVMPGPVRAQVAVEITMSNFRYCQEDACGPQHQAYVRDANGPVLAVDNPLGVIEVMHGDTVTWVYRDNGPVLSCDSFEACPGHKVVLETGGPAGPDPNFAAARSGETTITWTVPLDASGTIRYFCDVNNLHYQFGMTGALRIGGGY